MYMLPFKGAFAPTFMENKQTRVTASYLVNWCFEPSQPLWMISGLKETFIKRYIIAERTNKT